MAASYPGVMARMAHMNHGNGTKVLAPRVATA